MTATRATMRARPLVLLVGALAVAGCGSSSPSHSASSGNTSTGAVSGSGSAAVVRAAPNASLGKKILVNAQGRTLYVLSPETEQHLLCTSQACFSTWPLLSPSSSTSVSVGAGVQGRFGVLKRSDGTQQVTVNGLPLYTYSGDSAAGETNGQGLSSFGGTWMVVSASGQPISHSGSQSKAGSGGYY